MRKESAPRTVRVIPPERIAALRASYELRAAPRRRAAYAVIVAILILSALSINAAEVEPIKLLRNIGNVGDYFERALPVLRWRTLDADLSEWMWNLPRWLALLWETILIAYLATLFAALSAALCSFAAAANLGRNSVLRFAVRRVFEFCRTVPILVFALIFVRAFGLGATAGVLAVAAHSFGALGKLFFEAVENVEIGPVDGVRATGAGFAAAVRYAVLPQVLPSFLSYGLLRFEMNVREATIIGFVGAGGIGQDLYDAVRVHPTEASAMLVLILATVFAIAIVTGGVRKRLIAAEVCP